MLVLISCSLCLLFLCSVCRSVVVLGVLDVVIMMVSGFM